MAFGLVDGVKVRGHRNFAGVLTTIIPTGDCPHLGTGRLRTPASPSQPRQEPWGTGRSSGDLDGAVHLWVLLCCTHFPAEPTLTDGPPPPISPFHKLSLTEMFCGLKKKKSETPGVGHFETGLPLSVPLLPFSKPGPLPALLTLGI